jgi:hypothetical protein
MAACAGVLDASSPKTVAGKKHKTAAAPRRYLNPFALPPRGRQLDASIRSVSIFLHSFFCFIALMQAFS